MKLEEIRLRQIIREELVHLVQEEASSVSQQKLENPTALFDEIKKRWSDRVFPKVQLGDPDFVNSFVREMMKTFNMPNAEGYFKILEHLFSYRLVPGNEFWFGRNLNAFLSRAALYRLVQLKEKGVTSTSGVSLPEVIRQADKSMTDDPAGTEAMSLANKLGVKISPANLLQFTFSGGGFPGQYLAAWDEARKRIA